MSIPVSEESRKFILEEVEFRLGELLTEQAHPLSKEMSEASVLDGLYMINKIDKGMLSVYHELVKKGAFARPVEDVLEAIESGNNVFLCGCGATGRLSIQIEAVWRDFWKNFKRNKEIAKKIDLSLINSMEDQVVSVMAGGDYALIKSVENFEDHKSFGKKQILDMGLKKADVVFSITEGGETSFVIGTAWMGIDVGAKVHFVYNNPDEILINNVRRSREVIEDKRINKINLTTGPQALAGSTRMQAASIQTLVLGTIFAEVVYKILSKYLREEDLRTIGYSFLPFRLDEFARKKIRLAEIIKKELSNIAKLTTMEIETYEHGGNFFNEKDVNPNKGFVTYVGGKISSLVILTDTTERAPTFSTPAFRELDDKEMKASPSYMILPMDNNKEAWELLLKRSIRGLDWDKKHIKSCSVKRNL
ncbi:MAG: hypothetical protein P9M03_02155 [Candidatus Theseobacter exili]|nr:hypothetical protein [Candidatus Theseobacter exili]